MLTDLLFSPQLPAADAPTPAAAGTIIIGRRARLLGAVRGVLPPELSPVWTVMVESLTPGDAGDATATWFPGTPPRLYKAVVVPEKASRHNSPARPDAIAALCAEHTPSKGDVAVVVCLDHAEHAFAAGCAVARAFPLFSRKTTTPAPARKVTVTLLGPHGPITDLARIEHAAAGIRLAARLVDAPPSELSTDDFVREAEALASAVGAQIEVIAGEELARRGFGGLYTVGQTALHPPALVHLKHEPAGAQQCIAWVGKGIVYDTGGLALKARADMAGMKADMGGAAAVLGAFGAAVRSGFPERLHAILCLAENAIGPSATRPDDIITLYSGKTIEVNNPDAEGRLVVGDGVAYAAQHLAPTVIADLATLTGAQLVATGKLHAALVSNEEAWEKRAVAAGRASGDLLHPLPYAPELFRREFRSKVADLKNSVKDRNNAQSSCAAQFIAEQLGDYHGPWLHIDLAGPVSREERATGYGVALLLELFCPPRY